MCTSIDIKQKQKKQNWKLKKNQNNVEQNYL